MTITRADIAMAERRRDGHPAPPKRQPVTRKERDIQRAILAYLATVPGVVVWKSGSGLLPLADGRRVRMGAVGVSDLIGWMRTELLPLLPHDGGHGIVHPQGCGGACAPLHVARFIAIEIKRPGRFPTPVQWAFLDRVRASGGIAFVARSVDDVRRGLGR